jgi:hypothetical protein
MSPEKAFVPKKDRPSSYDHNVISGQFLIKIKPFKRSPGGRLSDLTFQDPLNAIGDLEFNISGHELSLDIAVISDTGAKAGR